MIVRYSNDSSDYPMMENSLFNVVAIKQGYINESYCFIVYYTDGTKTTIGKVADITFTEILREV